MIENNLMYLPALLTGEELTRRLQIFPPYDIHIRERSLSERLVALQDLYRVFIPNRMSREIYSKLYLALVRSLQKKQSILAVRQANENGRILRQQSYESIIGGADSFTIIGQSGIGKSASVSRAVQLLTDGPLFEIHNSKIIPCLTVQAPADSSVKGLILEILRKADEILGTKYYTNAVRSRASTDILIGSVSQAALNHIGLLIIDEIQNVVNSKNGKSIIGTLTQLINNSGVSICMVGTPEASVFFDQAMMLARRSLGLNYAAMEYGEEFRTFCTELLRYCYTKESAEIEESILMWLFNHSSGNSSIVVSLIHDAQEIALLEGYEKLDITSLSLAFDRRLSMLHGYLSPAPIRSAPPRKKNAISVPVPEAPAAVSSETSILRIISLAKETRTDAVTVLRQNGISVMEVAV